MIFTQYGGIIYFFVERNDEEGRLTKQERENPWIPSLSN